MKKINLIEIAPNQIQLPKKEELVSPLINPGVIRSLLRSYLFNQIAVMMQITI